MTYSPLAHPSAVRDVLGEYGLSAKKRLGQNFLADDNIVGRILELAGLEAPEPPAVPDSPAAPEPPAAPEHSAAPDSPAYGTGALPTIVEVGPGIGTLTVALLERADVIAIERDESLEPVLRSTIARYASDAPGRLEIVWADALDLAPDDLLGAASQFVASSQSVAPPFLWQKSRFVRSQNEQSAISAAGGGDEQSAISATGGGDEQNAISATSGGDEQNAISATGWAGAPGEGGAAGEGGAPSARVPHMVVANLPYGIAATLVLRWFEVMPFLDTMVVMVQSEVADRMCARPSTKEYGAYTVKLALRAEVTGRFRVAPSCFVPAPHVESSVIRLERTSTAEASDAPGTPDVLERASQIADAAFAQRRKTLRNSLRACFGDECTDAMLAAAGIDGSLRAETLDPAAYLALARAHSLCQKFGFVRRASAAPPDEQNRISGTGRGESQAGGSPR